MLPTVVGRALVNDRPRVHGGPRQSLTRRRKTPRIAPAEPKSSDRERSTEPLQRGLKEKALCVVQVQGQVQLEDRCAGLKKIVKAKLSSGPSIDAVVTLGPALVPAVANDVKTSNPNVSVATYAMNAGVYPVIKNGGIVFTIDQQPYLQGYMAIDSLWFFRKNGNIFGANQSISLQSAGRQQGQRRLGRDLCQGGR